MARPTPHGCPDPAAPRAADPGRELRRGPGGSFMFTDQWDGYGYDVYEVTPERFSAHMRVIDDRRDPASPVGALTTFHVDRGQAGSYEGPAAKNSPAQYRRD